MPSAIENLVKILKLEQKNGYNNKAVIGGLSAYAANWGQQAHQQAQRTDQHALVEELLRVMADYEARANPDTRHQLAKYMLDRITRRVEASPEYKVELAEGSFTTPSLVPPPSQTDLRLQEQAEAAVEAGEEPAITYPSAAEPAQTPDEILPVKPLLPAKAPKPRRRRQRRPQDPAEALKALQELRKPITTISGIGEAMAEKMAKLGAYTIQDLLFLFPRRYDDYTRLLPLRKLQPGHKVTIIATVRDMKEKVFKGNRRMLVLTVDDGSATMEINFFNAQWLKRQFKTGMQLVFSGKTEQFLGRVTMTNPDWEPVDQESLHTGGLVPIYPLTKGISARTMRRLMKKVVDTWADKVPEHLPESVLERTDLVDLVWAVKQIHFPEKQEYVDYARERFAFDDLLTLQLGVLSNRVQRESQPAPSLHVDEAWLDTFEQQLPFNFTNAQRKAILTIREDMGKTVPMNRLLQGDVGSGKTMVAAVTLAMAALNGRQAALMAPTSILAEQHYQKLSKLFAETPGLENAGVALLTGGISESERQAAYTGIAEGRIKIVIGTHAVIQGTVEFQDLAAVVIDEQHRFGVEQRGTLRGKGTNPHVLVMSATPIPRSLALTLYADLDLTVMDEMPPGRVPIQTKVITGAQRTRAYQFIEENVLKHGQQAYVIYPLVEASETSEAGAAVEGFDYLQKNIFPRYRLGLMHGRLRPADKEAVMEAFSRNETQVLVSTSVIEVGVDVPNATAIVIENADRFGLAQLHQFRGRVGRGDKKSFCLLVTEEEISERLEALENTTNGFELAELDWKLRGAGDLLGLRQSGAGETEIAEMMDSRLVALAQQESKAIYAEDPRLALPEHTLLARRVHQVVNEEADQS